MNSETNRTGRAPSKSQSRPISKQGNDSGMNVGGSTTSQKQVNEK